MAQRVLIGTCALLAAACLAMAGIFWQQAVVARQMMAREAAAARSREQEMLKQLRDMTTAIQNPRSLDWNRVQLSLREESADGPPLAGVVINFDHWTDQNARVVSRRETDETGMADFGLLHPGRYGFHITRSWGERTLSFYETIDVQPGEPVHKLIICPGSRSEQGDVRLKCEWPADLENAGLLLVLPLEFRYLEISPGERWNANPAKSFGLAHAILLGPSNTIYTVTPHGRPGREASSKPPLEPYIELPAEDLSEPLPPGSNLPLEIGNYGLSGLGVWRRAPVGEPGQKRFKRLVSAHSAARKYVQPAVEAAPAHLEAKAQAEKVPAKRAEFIELPPAYWARIEASFVARSGEANEWIVPLPTELIQAVREALEAEKSNKEKPAANAAPSKDNG